MEDKEKLLLTTNLTTVSESRPYYEKWLLCDQLEVSRFIYFHYELYVHSALYAILVNRFGLSGFLNAINNAIKYCMCRLCINSQHIVCYVLFLETFQ